MGNADSVTHFEILEYPNGSFTIRDTVNGEVMHSRIGPWDEAQTLYVRQSCLSERLRDSPTAGPLVVYDVGMGIAANAWAAIEARLALSEAGVPARPLKIISFENELAGLEVALKQPDGFGYLSRAASSLKSLIDSGHWNSSSGEVVWELRKGDFFSLLSPFDRPEIVFYDFYAPRSCPDLWSVPRLRQLREALETAPPGFACDLYTYSAATPVRVAFLLAGFFVGYGASTDAKNETTVAAIDPHRIKNPLTHRWLEKLGKSDRPFPWGEPVLTDRDALRIRVLAHPQFLEVRLK